jgi:hypothetical protein
MTSMVRLFVLAILCLFMWCPLWAQQKTPPCPQMEYEHHNMIDYGPPRVSAVRGSAKDFQGFVVSHVCVGVFSKGDHKLVAAAQADSEDLFEIRNIPNGKYLLIVASEGFCAANVPIILRHHSHGRKKLVATMKPSEVDVCSYVEWK